ncbi:hypothetical protein CDAR_303681 [Caerostris darwini]|uniref:Uncharacterized protein n=1 Tax=Caerostris darwini TaxID=1538125 RepID=A0AAV4UT95_9ARAC|nr:hypothetical protein CDAR_303681 [Caerostris darwini]
MNKRSVRQRQRMALKDRFPASYKQPTDWYRVTSSSVATRTVSVGVDNRVAYATGGGSKEEITFWQEWMRHFSIARRHIAMVRRLRFKNIPAASLAFLRVVSRITSRAGISIFGDGKSLPWRRGNPAGEASLCLCLS